LRQRDVARQIGVNKDTVHNWETNRTEVEVRLIPEIIDLLGYVPYDPNWSFGARLRAIRSALGLSQEQFVKRAVLGESTTARGEIGKHKPLEGKRVTVRGFLNSPSNDSC